MSTVTEESDINILLKGAFSLTFVCILDHLWWSQSCHSISESELDGLVSFKIYNDLFILMAVIDNMFRQWVYVLNKQVLA